MIRITVVPPPEEEAVEIAWLIVRLVSVSLLSIAVSIIAQTIEIIHLKKLYRPIGATLNQTNVKSKLIWRKVD